METNVILFGVLNSKCSDTSDYIEGVDDVHIPEVIDYGSNCNDDLLNNFPVDCNLCMVNGRKGSQEITCILKRCRLHNYSS